MEISKIYKDYLRCVKGVDRAVGRLLDYLDDNGLAENTLIVYTSDQGFYLGEHGWFDKRWMCEESFKMPFLIRCPGIIDSNIVSKELIMNIDFGPTLLDFAGIDVPNTMQGKSFKSSFLNKTILVEMQYIIITMSIHYGIKFNPIMELKLLNIS